MPRQGQEPPYGGVVNRAVVLVTGMSSTGKSTVLAELAHRGHHTLDLDEPGWSEEITDADGLVEQVWREDRVAGLLEDHRHDWLFLAGCASNQGRFYDAFDAVVLLSAPRDVMLDRLATRTSNPFGRTAADRARILADLEGVEPLLRASCTAEIVTTVPVREVADALEQVAAERSG